jgi:hypothetical protein
MNIANIGRIMGLGAIATVMSMTPLHATVIAFSGAFQNDNPPASPSGRCAPAARTVNIGPPDASGTSVLGDFIPTISHCIVTMPPADYTDGIFSFDYGVGNMLTGTYFGTLSAIAGLPTVFDNVQNFTVTGGTGIFLDASGAFTGTGQVTFTPGQLPHSEETLVGSLDLRVPEPTSLSLMIGGLGGLSCVGAMMRRKRQPTAMTT